MMISVTNWPYILMVSCLLAALTMDWKTYWQRGPIL